MIALDFGNHKMVTLTMTKDKTLLDLTRPAPAGGIPSVYYFKKTSTGGSIEKIGYEALHSSSSPSNRIRAAKLHLGETVTIDGTEIEYNGIITKMIQYAVREANRSLSSKCLPADSEIVLTYPAAFEPAQIKKLVELAEKATLEDGTGVHVATTLAEPAAALISYFDANRTTRDITALVADVGGGTTDLAVVSFYANAQKRPDGSTYQYDILAADKGRSIGGYDFDRCMAELIEAKIPDREKLTPYQKNLIADVAELSKIELSTSEETMPQISNKEGGIYEITISRGEYEEKCRPLCDKITEIIREQLANPSLKSPEMIVLCGASTRMPMIKKAIETAFPEYCGKIVSHEPERAIANGAAIFGSDPSNSMRRTSRHFGLWLADMDRNNEEFFQILIEAGTPVPSKPKELTFYSRFSGGDEFVILSAKPKTGKGSYTRKECTVIRQITLKRKNAFRPGMLNGELKGEASIDERYIFHFKVFDPSDNNRQISEDIPL